MTPGAAASPHDPIKFSNLKKIYWPAEKYTKGDLIDYYRADLRRGCCRTCANRPLVHDALSRRHRRQVVLPEGRAGVRAGVDAHDPIWSDDTPARHPATSSATTSSRCSTSRTSGRSRCTSGQPSVGSLEQPDWCVIDLDPKEAPFSDVIRCAQVLHRALRADRAAELREDDGQDGPAHHAAARPPVHVRAVAHARRAARARGAARARTTSRRSRGTSPSAATRSISTISRTGTARRSSRRSACGRCPARRCRCRCSWEEVVDGSNPKDYTIRNALERMERLGADPVAPVLTEVPDLGGVLGRLAGLLSS